MIEIVVKNHMSKKSEVSIETMNTCW